MSSSELSAEAPAPPRHSWTWFAGSLFLGALASGWALSSGMPREAAFMSGIFVLAAMLWVTAALPLFATALLVVGLEILLLANPGGWTGLGFASGPSPHYREILATAADPVLVLFFGGFVLAAAAVKEGVDHAISSWLLSPFGREPRWVLLGVILVTFTFGMWMSNTATATMMLALLTPTLRALPPGEPYRKALVLAVPFAANISGMTTPIASPPNAVAVGFVQKAGHSIHFFDWMLVAMPLAAGLALVTWMVLWRMFPPSAPDLRVERKRHTLGRRGWFVVGVFFVTVFLWMTDRWHGLPPSVVALLPAVVLTVTRIFSSADLASLNWDILILIAGGIALGSGMLLTGLDKIVVQWLPVGAGSVTLLLILVAVTFLIGNFMSNTAAANLLLPIGLSASESGALHPIQVAISLALVASLSMTLPISTPPNALAYARGEFSTKEMMRASLIISLIGLVLIAFGGTWIMRLWGLIP